MLHAPSPVLPSAIAPQTTYPTRTLSPKAKDVKKYGLETEAERQRRRQQMEKYLLHHNMPTVIEALVTGLCVERPEVPREYLLSGLRHIRDGNVAVTWCVCCGC